mgnify:FL=1
MGVLRRGGDCILPVPFEKRHARLEAFEDGAGANELSPSDTETTDRDLVPIHSKLQQIVARERAKEWGAESIEEVVGKINSSLLPTGCRVTRTAARCITDGSDAGWMEGDLDLSGGSVVVDSLDEQFDQSGTLLKRYRFPEVIEFCQHITTFAQARCLCDPARLRSLGTVSPAKLAAGSVAEPLYQATYSTSRHVCLKRLADHRE